MAEDGRPVTSLTDYLAVVRRRKWVLLEVLVLVPAVAVFISLSKPARYQATAQVLLNQQNATPGVTQSQTYVDPNRVIQTEAELARSPAIADRVAKAAHVPGMTPTSFLKTSSVTPSSGSDFLVFGVTDGDPTRAKRLVKLYARTFTNYRNQLAAASLHQGEDAATRRLAQLEAAGLKGSSLYRSVQLQQRQFETLITLQQPTDVVLPDSNPAQKVSAHAGRNGAIGLVLGLILGLIAIFLIDGLDTRVRTVEDIAKRLGMRLLGRFPTPDRHSGGLAMLRAPMSDDAEAFRVLRATLDVANVGDRARSIMVTSADAGEGKSTTVANLAVAFARAGRRVVLVDADLRGPSLHALFQIPETPGFVDVQLGDVTLDEALTSIPTALPGDSARGAGTRFERREGSLAVLPAGQRINDPDELDAGPALGRIVKALGDRADLVLVDAGGLLALGDSLAMSSYVDALLLVVRLNTLQMKVLDELGRVLSTCPAEKLGFVVTGVQPTMPLRRSERHPPSEPSRFRSRAADGSAKPVTPLRSAATGDARARRETQ
jgi:non-specific protein-tyrosine kinase